MNAYLMLLLDEMQGITINNSEPNVGFSNNIIIPRNCITCQIHGLKFDMKCLIPCCYGVT